MSGLAPDFPAQSRSAGAIAPARRVAFDLLCALRQSPQTHSDTLLRSGAVTALSAADRNLVTALVMGVLRWEIALDQRIAAASTKAQAPALPVEVALALGALQLLMFDRIPAHAAIFESVELVKQAGHAHAAGFVNAVLRKISRSPRLDANLADANLGPAASPAQLALRWGHPSWLVERWAAAYGLAQASAICRFDQNPPPVTLRLSLPQAEEALAQEGVQLEPGEYLAGARRVVAGDVASTRAFAQGWVRIQDEASQLIAEIAAAGGAASILDCCAAPGGKLEILAERNPQAAILACDVHPARLRAMRARWTGREGAARISFRATDVVTASFDRQFDLVLCDAPCSGTGTLARNPEIRHRLAPQDLSRQRLRQIKILSAAMRQVAAGGRIVYSTCSMEPEENEEVVQRALAANAGFRLVPWQGPMRELERTAVLRPGSADALCASASPFLRTIPGIHPCDGFFAALMLRQ